MQGERENMQERKQPKRRNVADTSRKAYHEIVDEGIPQNEQKKVVKILKAIGPLTSRQLSIAAKKERTNMTRALNELIKIGKAFIHHKDKYSITGRTVNFYSLVVDSNDDSPLTDQSV